VGKFLRDRLPFSFSASWQGGYSLVEITLVSSIIVLLLGLVTLNLFKFQHTSQLSATVNSFLADYKQQQLRSMYGDTAGTGSLSNYGIFFGTSSYTEFQNTYGTSNFVVNLPSGTQFSTTFPSSQIIFLKGSGQVSGFSSGRNTITILDTVDGSRQTITVNQYGVVTSVN
jgi:type II secretory pathway pseudopilin PulG